ncbi:SPW_0924 family protein [Streptomyces melanogenes]|uniref:SPW_0924 family protein n=2 Tax=Streptomyces TaxID=1883 RepID=A0ABZ1XIX1_9ACTN|nr:SPW_0924 family protein [Streptomyces melanogenes]
MRALVAAAIGLAAALAIVLTVSAIGGPEGTTSPKPLLTTVPTAPGAVPPGK